VVVGLSVYQDALDNLFARTTGATRLGLERTSALLSAIGNPHTRFASFHVAGTNGKGSVAAVLERLLRRMGHKVGKYTSPHLVDFRERIVVDGIPVDESRVVGFLTRNESLIARTNATFFEATTAMAFDAFAEARVDVAVVETGLGGRLDATNVVMPEVAVVTSIGMDHMEYLGSNIRDIAREKAGIFKRGVPAVIGERTTELRTLLGDMARGAGSSSVVDVAHDYLATDVQLTPAATSFRLTSAGVAATVRLGLAGMHQVHNACSAIAAVFAAAPRYHPDAASLAGDLADLVVPGRCQSVGRMVFDVAHNPDGAAALVETLRRLYPGELFLFVLCVLGDKDWRGMIRLLSPVAAGFVFTNAPSAPRSRQWDLAAVGRDAATMRLAHELVPDFGAALSRISRVSERVVVTGSFHTVGDAMSRLQLSPLSP
jgi:dihydrofolate synthase/folylpolyglutamate synthase